MPLRFASVVLALCLFAGCSSPCVDIQVLLCTCEGQTQDERNQCKTNAQSQEDALAPSEAETTFCTANYDACAAQIEQGCETLQTPAGRAVCGLALEK